jgi:ATP-dependent DNA ligase
VGANSHQGAVYVFTRSGNNWTQQAKLTAADGADGDLFGTSLAIYGDTVIVGAPHAEIGNSLYAGAAYIFTRSGSNWTQQAKLTADDRAFMDRFGNSVDIEGDMIIVGAPNIDVACNTNQGIAYIFTRSGNSWTLQNRLIASDGMAEALPRFGNSVALSGNMAVVGASYADAAGNYNQGAAYLYERTSLNESVYLPITIGTSFFCPDEE